MEDIKNRDQQTKYRWIMRMTNGQEFTTQEQYTKDEVDTWQCSKPVKPIAPQRYDANS